MLKSGYREGESQSPTGKTHAEFRLLTRDNNLRNNTNLVESKNNDGISLNLSSNSTFIKISFTTNSGVMEKQNK